MMRKYWLLMGWVWWICCVVAQPKYEIRAVWLTTVYGLDWPGIRAVDETSRQKQQQQLCKILDKLQEAHFNTVFIQTRLRGDVLYRSAVEPFSKVLAGQCGRSPGYDPLAFAIDECHKRGMECHAWFVTFPLGTEKSVKEQGKHSVVKQHPHLCVKHNGEWFLNPGVPGTSDYILSLVKEIVLNYDIDGIHFDYIRYPEQGNKFPDKKSFSTYGKNQELAGWRRGNIDKMVCRIYDWVKKQKPWVQVSSSPLGKYSRIPRVPNAGWTAYESVFQDPKCWMEQGRQDMVAPMMYYLHDNFFPFVDNWVDNCNGRLIVPGLGVYRMEKNEADWTLNDITDQIDYSRYFGASGNAFFRCENILNNTKGIYDELKNNYYKYPAMQPPLVWLSDTVPPAPTAFTVERAAGELKLSWLAPPAAHGSLTYTVYYSCADSIRRSDACSVLATGIHATELYLPVDTTKEQGFLFSVTASTRYHIESDAAPEVYYYWSAFEK